VKTARTGRGFNPYKNPILKDLYERGKTERPNSPTPASGASASRRPAPRRSRAQAARRAPAGNRAEMDRRGSSAPSQSMRSNPFDPPRRMDRRP